MAGNIPGSDKTEYRPPINSLCLIISTLYLPATSINLLSAISVMMTNLFFNKFLENNAPKFVIVSSVLPDLETTIKHEFFIFFIFYILGCKFKSKLSKKNTFFLIFFLKNE